MKSIAMFRNVIVLAALGASAGLALSGPLAGLTQSTNIGVSTTVVSNCLVSTPSAGLSFGTYNPLSETDNTAFTTFKVRCSKNAGYTIGLSKGGGASESVRKMALPNELSMDYGLYSDSAHGANWGTVSGTVSGNGTGLGTDIELTVYGKITAGQLNVGVGNYSDTVVATISY